MTQDLDPHLHPVGQSKLSRSLIPTEKQLTEKSVIERLAKLKAVVMSYDLWMIRSTHIGMPSTTATDGVSLYLSVMEAVDNFGLEAKIVGITSDGGGNLRFFREALESKYTNDPVFSPPKTLFTMYCLAHILAGACKAGVQ